MKPMTMKELEQLSTHELADLLANLVLLLRRLPDVPMVQLTPVERPPIEAEKIAINVRKGKRAQTNEHLPDWAASEDDEEPEPSSLKYDLGKE